ncbi:hypothetical protein PILCRDRAFT_69185 [Piloderma croceum F 1598]|uniref:Uncharacterized protein n=1 Tax=Piloderma croceum (strain F 1598) TaxID=765440 RepID=A0A0C3C2A8_PILCF|nr:hypothetical protein PILCRDRAFT_69185 [Piloderma croceum F 1598]
MSSPATCNSFCQNPGTLRCTRCKGANLKRFYCSAACQSWDWKFHKQYCSKKAYTFELTLLGSSNPDIKRVFDIPAWFTFRQLHYTIQYAMGLWNCTHLHEFSFQRLSNSHRNLLTPRHDILKIMPADHLKDEFDMPPMPGMPPRRHVFKEREESLLLSDIFDPAGRLRCIAAPDEEFLPLIYLYDFGVCINLYRRRLSMLMSSM